MKGFWLRFSVFSIIIICIITTSVEKELIPYSILLFTCTFGLFFFVSVGKKVFLLYIGMSLIIWVHYFLLINTINMFTVLLILFIAVIASYNLSEKQMMIYAVLNFVISIIASYSDIVTIIEMTLLSLLFYFLLINLNRMAVERKEQKRLYDSLSSEYRQLKRLNLRVEEAARNEERTKIARDIHDSVGHRLTALIMKLEMLSIQNPAVDYRDLRLMASESLEETRGAVKALQVEETEGLGTVVQLIRKLESESHILVQFTVKQGVLSTGLSNEKSVALYRVIQEALTNAMRHAQAREVHIILGKSANGAISFEILNGQYEAREYELGFGLTSMKERVAKVNGSLHIYQTESKFVVSGTIPVKEG